ncbi:MCE family protein [Thermoleophilia bacterium SCSIO 60948]|nr:MCE family protein [Thermoleophilia bacterium SCSIO 60948]
MNERPGNATDRASSGDARSKPLGWLVVAAMLALAGLSVVALDGVPFSGSQRVGAVLAGDAPIVRPGDEVRVAGQRVGQVSDVELDDSGRRRIEMKLDSVEATREASAEVHTRGLSGAVYVELRPGDGEAAPDDYTLATPAESGTQLTDVIASFDDAARGDVRRVTTGLGGAVAGRGGAVNRTLARSPELLRDGTPLLRALRPGDGELEGLVGDSTAVSEAIAEPEDAVRASIRSGSDLLGVLSGRREDIGASIDAAPAVFDELEATTPVAVPLLRDLRATSVALTPAAGDLEDALPALDGLLARDDDVERIARLARASDPLLDVAPAATQALDPAARTLGPLVDAGSPLAAYAGRYPEDILAGPTGFTTWGDFSYDEGQASGHRAVRFTPVFTCAPGRNPYPEPGAAGDDREPCLP